MDPDALTGWVIDMPVHVLKRGTKTRRELDLHQLASMFSFQMNTHAFIEDVHSMPGQGVASAFTFGECKGGIKGILAAHGIPFTMVAPVTWKKALQVPAAKDGARARASQLMPTFAHEWPLVKHHGRAEAALIALYGYRLLNEAAKT